MLLKLFYPLNIDIKEEIRTLCKCFLQGSPCGSVKEIMHVCPLCKGVLLLEMKEFTLTDKVILPPVYFTGSEEPSSVRDRGTQITNLP